jgi:hypothetical protein
MQQAVWNNPTTMKIAKINPLTVLASILLLLFLKVVIAAAPIAFFQNAENFLNVNDIITWITFFGLIAGALFWVIKVKNYKMMEETNAQLKEQNEALLTRKAELKEQLAEKELEIKNYQWLEEQVKKLELRK